MGKKTDTAQRIRERSAANLKAHEDQLTFVGIESQFPWVKTGEIIWARTRDFQAAMFYALPEKEPVLLNGSDGLKALSELVLAQTGALPDSLTPEQLAGAIRKLTLEPRGFVGSKDFYAKQAPHLAAWLHQDTPAERERFEQHAADPELHVFTKAGTWTLSFYYFNPQGGVERWVSTGHRSAVLTAKRSEALPNGTFRWPYRGST